MKTLTTLIIVTTLSFINYAQDQLLKDVSETQQISEKVVKYFEQNKISAAFQLLSKYWPMNPSEIDGLETKTIKYLGLVEERFGKTIGYTKIKNETIGDFAIRETYLLRYENNAIRLIFTYYKNDKGWIVNAFKWDDSYTEEFK